MRNRSNWRVSDFTGLGVAARGDTTVLSVPATTVGPVPPPPSCPAGEAWHRTFPALPACEPVCDAICVSGGIKCGGHRCWRRRVRKMYKHPDGGYCVGACK
jgi:hypothetical protein